MRQLSIVKGARGGSAAERGRAHFPTRLADADLNLAANLGGSARGQLALTVPHSKISTSTLNGARGTSPWGDAGGKSAPLRDFIDKTCALSQMAAQREAGKPTSLTCTKVPVEAALVRDSAVTL